ncbi:MAG: beta-propeller domain-containing protein [Archaeoglobaceae archaeon]
MKEAKIALVLVLIAIFFAILALQIPVEKQEAEVKSFNSPQEFRDYVSRGQGYVFSAIPERFQISSPMLTPSPLPATAVIGKDVAEIERFSTTNVQVLGIDEPDIVKTDGKMLYISKSRMPYFVKAILPPIPYEQKTVVLKAFPPQEMEKVKELNFSGDLFLHSEVLILLRSNQIRAFDTRSFEEKYSIELNGTLITARLYEGKVYAIISQYPETCPIIPLRVDNRAFVVECSRIYHPVKPIPVEITYTVVRIDAKTGNVEKAISFVGNYNSVVYMSKNAIYVAYYTQMSYFELMSKFVLENKDLFPDWFIEKLEKIKNYEISEQAKQIEILEMIRRLTFAMKPEDRIVFENEFNNRLKKFMEKNAREIEKTAIWKISKELEIIANGEVPGRLLNQFSMDEHRNYLRVAVTVGNANDLYVLDSKLRIVGSLMGFGETERIFGVRFIGERGYVVTFRQIDPFFVIDLSNPTKPELAGELKIPGYSSYLHPIEDNFILGIGMENGAVKISLFNVSNPRNPVEIDKYILKESWSEVISNHRAFLSDEKHGIFFLPAGNGYVFSYKSGLKLIKATETGFRAVFINDYLYVIGKKLVVFDENSWEKVAELEI